MLFVPLRPAAAKAAQLLQNEEFSSMRRLLSSGLVVFAGLVVIPAAVAPPSGARTDYTADPRFELLTSFFSKMDCPARHYVEVFLDAADRYALDWRLLPSLSFIESTGGRHAKGNNLFGWGTEEFDTPTAGITPLAIAWLPRLYIGTRISTGSSAPTIKARIIQDGSNGSCARLLLRSRR
jgi:hypothetical protein